MEDDPKFYELISYSKYIYVQKDITKHLLS
jgi:hypothetical protein